MTVNEKAAYVKGLIEGLELDGKSKEGKAINAILDWIDTMSEAHEELEEDVDDVCEQMSILDEDLSEVEKEVFGECDCCGCDDDLYEVKCPKCGERTCFDEDALCDGEIDCPNCGEKLEFDLDNLDDCDCDCDECDDECECGCHGDKE